MAALSENIVREFFELHGFLVRQPHKYIVRSSRELEEADLLVVNPGPAPAAEPLPFILEAEHLQHLARALVVVKGWHTETFSSSRLAQHPQIFQFASPTVVKQAERDLGQGPPLTRILVLPTLPQAEDARAESIQVMRTNGVDAAIPFATVLADLFRRVEVNRDYHKSDVLQLLRILKNYDLLRDPQLELFKPRRPRKVRPAASEPV